MPLAELEHASADLNEVAVVAQEELPILDHAIDCVTAKNYRLKRTREKVDKGEHANRLADAELEFDGHLH